MGGTYAAERRASVSESKPQQAPVEEHTTETTVTQTLEAIGGALIITLTGLDTTPPGTHIMISITTPDAREGVGVSGETSSDDDADY
jgi:hypothetical protein